MSRQAQIWEKINILQSNLTYLITAQAFQRYILLTVKFNAGLLSYYALMIMTMIIMVMIIVMIIFTCISQYIKYLKHISDQVNA